MSLGIKVFEKGSEARERLEKLAVVLTIKSPRHYQYYVGETYFDFGQNWKWTTVLCDTGERGVTGSYQALNPANQEAVLLCDGSLEKIAEVADAVLGGKYCPDRIKDGA